jgi:hypothetical protein
MDYRITGVFAGIAIGGVLNLAYALWSGRFPIGPVFRAQNPTRFWQWIAATAVVSVVSAIVFLRVIR